MSFNEHRYNFAGKKIRDYDGGALSDVDGLGLRIREEYDDSKSWNDRFQELLSQPNVAGLTTLVIGTWGQDMFEHGPENVIQALVVVRDQLPKLTAIFLGDITYEENELSWIHQADLSPLFSAYPRLEHFAVRGSDGLTFGILQHANLESLVVQSGGLDAGVVREILTADLPNLEHLEIYLGTENYGANTQLDDLTPLLRGELFPKLTYLGLRNWDRADELAGVLANAPILQRIKELDISLGTLSDAGVKALMTSPYLDNLEKLDIHHHFISPETLNELKAHLRKLKVKIDASDPQEADEDGDEVWRFVAHGE